jgi:hypothetical protein
MPDTQGLQRIISLPVTDLKTLIREYQFRAYFPKSYSLSMVCAAGAFTSWSPLVGRKVANFNGLKPTNKTADVLQLGRCAAVCSIVRRCAAM